MQAFRASWAAATCALCVALTGGSLSSATAQERQWSDGEGDMWYNEDPRRAAPDETNADIRQVSVDHRRGTLVIIVKFTDLYFNADDTQTVTPIWGMARTNEGKWRYFAADRWGGETHSYVESASRPVDCESTATIDKKANTATLRMWRSCLSKPRWARVYIASSASSYDASDDSYLFYGDDAMDAKAPGIGTTEATYTRRIYRD